MADENMHDMMIRIGKEKGDASMVRQGELAKSTAECVRRIVDNEAEKYELLGKDYSKEPLSLYEADRQAGTAFRDVIEELRHVVRRRLTRQ